MKKTLTVVFFGLVSLSALAAIGSVGSVGTIEVTPASSRENTLDLIISGDAATAISEQLADNGVSFRRDPFSGALVQVGNGVRCIDQHAGKSLYCYIGITGSSVN